MLIEVAGLMKRYGSKKVLDGVSFAVEPGEVVALAGVNGAGKSTTIGILMGFLEAHGGRVEVLSHDPLGRRHLGEVGWMPEQPAFPKHLKVRQLIDFQAATFPNWDPERARQLCERLEIDSSAKVTQLSRGQRGRVALLLALAHRPKLLLLDDPTLGLDPAGRRLLLGELLAASAEEGAGVLLSTHLLAEVDQALDRLLILSGGRIVQDCAIEQLKQQCRLLEIPPQAPPPPPELAVITGPEGSFSTHWDEGAWRRYAAQVPGARRTTVGTEDIFVGLTRGGLAAANDPLERSLLQGSAHAGRSRAVGGAR